MATRGGRLGPAVLIRELPAGRLLLVGGALASWLLGGVLWQLVLDSARPLGLVGAGVGLLLVLAILRVSLHVSKSQFLRLWALVVPLMLSSIPQLLPGVFTAVLLLSVWFALGLWLYHRWWPVGIQFAQHGLHTARFAGYRDIQPLLSPNPPANGLLLGRSHTGECLSVRPTQSRRELGNLLIVGPTRSGKGLLATSQLLSWRGSVVVNDIKGELFAETAGYRKQFSDVYVIDPTGVGHQFDPLHSRVGEDQLFSAASFLLHEPKEGDGRVFTQHATAMLTQLFLAARQAGEFPLPYARGLIRLGLPEAALWLNEMNPELATQFLDSRFEDADLRTNRFLCYQNPF